MEEGIMKKILVTILCGAMLLGMTACDQNGTKETKKTADGTESMETAGEADEGENSELKEVNVVLDWYPNAVHALSLIHLQMCIRDRYKVF